MKTVQKPTRVHLPGTIACALLAVLSGIGGLIWQMTRSSLAIVRPADGSFSADAANLFVFGYLLPSLACLLLSGISLAGAVCFAAPGARPARRAVYRLLLALAALALAGLVIACCSVYRQIGTHDVPLTAQIRLGSIAALLAGCMVTLGAVNLLRLRRA